MGMADRSDSALLIRLARAARFGYRKTSRIGVGFLPEVWVSVIWCDLLVIWSEAIKNYLRWDMGNTKG